MKEYLKIHNLKSLIKEATRYGLKKSSLDKIITSPEKVYASGIIDFNISDITIYVTLKHVPVKREKTNFIGRTYKNYDAKIFAENLINDDWAPFDSSPNPDIAWEIMLSIITRNIDKMCPLMEFKIKKIKERWLHDDLLEFLIDKDRLLSKARKTGDEQDWTTAKRARNLAISFTRKAKSDFINYKLEQNSKNGELFGESLKEAIPCSRKAEAI